MLFLLLNKVKNITYKKYKNSKILNIILIKLLVSNTST